MQNYALKLCYDGTKYRGWQRLSNTEQTIQGKLEAVLSRFAGEPVEVIGSGRTDAGVHALAQTASFRLKDEAACDAVLASLRQYLPEDIGAIEVRPVPPDFHARYSAVRKSYRYRVWNSTAPCVFERRYVYCYPNALNLQAMQLAAEALTGTHDFAAFCTGMRKKSTVRTLEKIEIDKQGNEVRLDFTGDGFLYNMVRILTGTLLEIGDGRRTPQSVAQTLASGVRENAGFTVPAKGLCFMGVEYGIADLWHDEVL